MLKPKLGYENLRKYRISHYISRNRHVWTADESSHQRIKKDSLMITSWIVK